MSYNYTKKWESLLEVDVARKRNRRTNLSTSLASAMLQSPWRERRVSTKRYSDSRNKKLSRHVTKLLKILEKKVK